MKVFMADPFQVKRLERAIGRELTPEEKAGEKSVKYVKDGKRVIERVKQLNFRDLYSRG